LTAGKERFLHHDSRAGIVGRENDHQQDYQQGTNHYPAAGASRLQIHKGDELVYRIDGDRVILTKAKREPIEDPFATFSEWSSEADQRAYADL
jgi:antitoxin PrlF